MATTQIKRLFQQGRQNIKEREKFVRILARAMEKVIPTRMIAKQFTSIERYYLSVS